MTQETQTAKKLKKRTFALVIVQWMNGRMYVIHQEAHKNPLYRDMLHHINQLIQKYSLCKVFIDSSAANAIKYLLNPKRI